MATDDFDDGAARGTDRAAVADGARSPLVEGIVERLAARIRAGEFRVDQRLPGEHDLAALFAVSRPTVRQALRRLRDDGLVYSRRGSGTYVRAVPSDAAPSAQGFAPVETIADIQRCYEFRATIEPEHAYWAALRWDAARLAAVGAALDRLRDATRLQHHREDADFDFHFAIAEASNNHYYVSSMAALKDHIGVGMKVHGLSVLGPGPSLEHVFTEHLGIFEAIRRRDAARARQLMRLHIEGSRDRVFGGHTLDLAFEPAAKAP